MKHVFFTLFIFINAIVMAQDSKSIANNLCKEWILEKGWFDQDEIILEKKNIKKHTTLSYQFKFHNNGKLFITIYNPENLGFCGMGKLSIIKAQWYLIDSEIMMDIEGSHITVDEFHYKIIYNLGIEKNILTLKRLKTIIADVKHY